MFTGNRVVLTGVGVLAANGIGQQAFWSSLLEGASGVGPITLFDCTDLPCRIAGEVKGFDPGRLAPLVKSNHIRRLSRASQLGIAATFEALQDAGLTLEDLRRGGLPTLVAGTSTAAMDIRSRPARPWSAAMGIPHSVGSATAYAMDMHARLTTVSSGCASGLDAAATAAMEIQRGHTDFALALAADSTLERYSFECFSLSRMLSLRNEDPQHADRPFDRDRDGGVIGEGAGALVFENRDHALARGAGIYAEIIGFGSSMDPPESAEGSGLEYSMRAALSSACLSPERVEAVSAHAPGDKALDMIEAQAVKEVFGPHAYRLPVFSIKAVTANAMGGGSMFQVVAAALTLRDGWIPPTANLEHPDPQSGLDHVQGSARLTRPEIILVNSHSMGRGNSSLVLMAFRDGRRQDAVYRPSRCNFSR